MDRFWSKVAKTDDPTQCWPWLAHLNGSGYGGFKLNGRNHIAHRLAYEFVNGEIPVGMFVLHRCDNPRCCNPDHLFLGTLSDNMRDCVDKGRATQLKTAWAAGRIWWDERTQEERDAWARRAAVARWSKQGGAKSGLNGNPGTRRENREAHNAYHRAWRKRKADESGKGIT